MGGVASPHLSPSGCVRQSLQHIRPIIVRQRRPRADDFQTRAAISEMGALVGLPAGRVPVEEQNETFEPIGQQDMASPFCPEDRPDRNPVQSYRGERRFYTFCKAKDPPGGHKLDRATAGTPEHHAWFGKITCARGGRGIQEGAVDSDDPAPFAHRGDQRWTERYSPTPPERCARIVAQIMPGRLEPAIGEIDFSGCRGEWGGRTPCPQRRPGARSRDMDMVRWDRYGPIRKQEAQTPDRSQDVQRIAAREAFEQQRASADPDRKAGTVVIMGGAQA